MKKTDEKTLRSVVSDALVLSGMPQEDVVPLFSAGVKYAAQVGSMAMDYNRGRLPAAELEALEGKAAVLIDSEDKETAETAEAVMLFLWAGEQEE